MTEITFTIKDSQARAWEKVLGAEFDQDNFTLNQMVKLAVHRFIYDIASREAEKAFAEMKSGHGIEGE